MRRQHLCPAVVVLLWAGCAGSGSSGGDDGSEPPATSGEAAGQAAAHAARTVELVEDLGSFIADGMLLPGGILPFKPLEISFQTDSCQGRVSAEATQIEVGGECTMPSGRHVRGMLFIGFDSTCGFGGLRVAFDVLTESQPGANDEVAVRGEVNLSHGAGALWLATRAEVIDRTGAHDLDLLVNGCFVVDAAHSQMAMDGAVSVDIDAQPVHLSRVSDLQTRFCEALPYTGSIRVEHQGHVVVVTFTRDTPDSGTVILSVDGQTSQVTVPAVLFSLCANPPPATPVVYDWAACGGCDNPSPPPDDPDDPVTPPEEPVID